MKSTVLILDFDGVLFNGEKFKKDYVRIFGGFGISPRAIRIAYQEGKSHARGYHHALGRRFASELDAKIVTTRAASLLQRSPEYLYPDAKNFLRRCQDKKIRLVLLSTGPAFQRRKIEASGIASFFTHIVVIQGDSKISAMRKIIRMSPEKEVVFVDDTTHVIEEIKRKLPDVFLIQMTRKREIKQSAQADARVHNFKAVTRILKGRAYLKAA